MFEYEEHQEIHKFDEVTKAAMSNQYKQVNLDDAVAGMVLSEAIMDRHGGILLPAATTLSDAMLTSLRRRAIDSIYIVNNELSDADLKAAREHARQRLTILFRKCSGSGACALLLQHVTEYRMGEAG